MDNINEISYYLNKCYTLSNTSQMRTFSFRKTTHRCIVCVTQSNWVKMWFSHFPVLSGSAEAQVTWGGIVKHLLIAYFIGNLCAKKYQNPFMCVKVIASQRWDVFWDMVYSWTNHGNLSKYTILMAIFKVNLETPLIFPQWLAAKENLCAGNYWCRCLTGWCPSCHPTNNVKALKAIHIRPSI